VEIEAAFLAIRGVEEGGKVGGIAYLHRYPVCPTKRVAQ
jgi:hypothetical protein